jgi:ribosome-associated protein
MFALCGTGRFCTSLIIKTHPLSLAPEAFPLSAVAVQDTSWLEANMTSRPISKKASLSRTNKAERNTLIEATRRKALDIAGWLQEKKALDVSVLDVSPFSSVADVMIILTAQSARHAQALADWLLEKFAENNIAYRGMEGYSEGRWILVDSNDILVHIFQEESRNFYNLDGLWFQSRSLLTHADTVIHPSAGSGQSSPTQQAGVEQS